MDPNADMEQEPGGNRKLNSVYLERNKKSQPSWSTIN